MTDAVTKAFEALPDLSGPIRPGELRGWVEWTIAELRRATKAALDRTCGRKAS